MWGWTSSSSRWASGFARRIIREWRMGFWFIFMVLFVGRVDSWCRWKICLWRCVGSICLIGARGRRWFRCWRARRKSRRSIFRASIGFIVGLLVFFNLKCKRIKKVWIFLCCLGKNFCRVSCCWDIWWRRIIICANSMRRRKFIRIFEIWICIVLMVWIII